MFSPLLSLNLSVLVNFIAFEEKTIDEITFIKNVKESDKNIGESYTSVKTTTTLIKVLDSEKLKVSGRWEDNIRVKQQRRNVLHPVVNKTDQIFWISLT